MILRPSDSRATKSIFDQDGVTQSHYGQHIGVESEGEVNYCERDHGRFMSHKKTANMQGACLPFALPA